MKSDVFDDRYYIECACGSTNHVMTFEIYQDDNPRYDDICIGVATSYREPLWKRILIAVRYIFKKEPFYFSDTIIIEKRNIQQLEEVIERIKKGIDEKENDTKK